MSLLAMSPFIFILFLPIFPIITFLTQHKHLLIILLSLEGIILTLTLSIRIRINSITQINIFITLFLLALGACEAALGLAILVTISRNYGSDILNLLSINKC